MAGAQFEYDEVGSTFFYFLVSFYALLLLPATFYLWPKKKSADEVEGESGGRCHCEGCEVKSARNSAALPRYNRRKLAIRGGLVAAWALFALLLYRVTLIEADHKEYDPYEILGLDKGADVAEVRKKYRELSKVVHPDRGGDPVQFDRIAKAYQALTDDESRDNWEKYGNPDGPGATTFGIALPKWLVSKEYGVWVLAAYGFIFMIVLPVGVGIWWYNSIKYSVDQVLMDTTQLFGYMFHKTPNMLLKRVLMILASSFEFWKQYNKDIVERESDEREMPLLIKELPNLAEKNKERPLCLPYSIKARALIHAHLSRLSLSSEALEKDQAYIVRKGPILVQEMIQVVSQLVMYAANGRVARMPTIETVENTMRVLPMLVQALWETRSPLLQLPHFSEDMLRHCVTKKRRVKTCSDLASLDETERRSLLRNLSDDEYADVLHVLKMMPRISVKCHVEVQGEDDKDEITAGSLVTVKVNLKRTSLLDLDAAPPPDRRASVDHGDGDDEIHDEEPDENGEEGGGTQPLKQQRKPWEKQKKKKGGKGNKNKAKPKPAPSKKALVASRAADATLTTDDAAAPSTDSPRASRKKERKEDESVSGGERSEESDGSASASEDDEANSPADDQTRDEEPEDDDLIFDDELIKKELVLETKSKVTHPVHCPFFPDEKYEWWWLYLFDKKNKRLVGSAPVHCTTLVDEAVVELKLPAPPKSGHYTFTVAVRSDSYLDCDTTTEVKLNVLEARQVTSHPQWDFPSEDEGHKSDSEHSDASEYTEGEEDDD